MQVPAVKEVAVEPETVQTVGVVEVKMTVSPEVDVAERATDVPTNCAGIDANAIVCGLSLTAKLRVTGVAAK